ncbi:pyridoxamine 5'-phosphate oxidase family protein [Paenibacillus tarimensis]
MPGIYHPGEIAVQKLAGAEIIAEQNGRGIKNRIPKGAVAFLSTQTLVVAASVDKKGRVWCSMLTGEPGFIAATDDAAITIRSGPVKGDPLNENLAMNYDLGLLVIDFSKKLRLRINGTGRFDEHHQTNM